MANVFEDAKPKESKPKRVKKDTKPQVELGMDLDVLAAADALVKTLKTTQETYGTKVKQGVTEHFVKEGMLLKRRPENVRGLGLKSSASLEMRKRDERRVLTEDEVALLTRVNVRMKEVVVQEEAFIINPQLMNNPKHKDKIAQALGLLDFDGESVLVKQERITAMVVTEESLDDAFANAQTPEEERELISVVSTLAAKPTFNGSLMEAAQVLVEAGIKL